MKKSFYFFTLLILLLSNSCKEDFDLTAEYKEIPIIYGLLNQKDAFQYIRIQKGFLIDGDATVAALQPDSIYFKDSIRVSIRYLPNGPENILTLVDGNLIGLPKPTGAFANSPNLLYRTGMSLDPNKTYQLKVKNINTQKEYISQTNLISDFGALNVEKGSPYSLIPTSGNPKLLWISAKNAAIYDMYYRIHYKEFDFVNGTNKDTFADIKIASNKQTTSLSGGTQIEQSIDKTTFFQSLRSAIPVNPNVNREFNKYEGLDIYFYCGAPEISAYISSQQAQSGFTSNEAIPPYTNITGGGFGIFSSRYLKIIDSVMLSANSLDEISCNEITRPLRFKNNAGIVCF